MARPIGLSLVEILIAGAIVVTALLTMIGVFSSGIQLLSRGEDMAVATGLTRELLERSRQVPFDDLPVGEFDGGVPDLQVGDFPPAPYPERAVEGNDYKMLVTVTLLKPNLKSVIAEARWKGDRSLKLETYVAE